MNEKEETMVDNIVEFINNSDASQEEWYTIGDGMDSYSHLPSESNRYDDIPDFYLKDINFSDHNVTRLFEHLMTNYNMTDKEISDILAECTIEPDTFRSYYVGYVYDDQHKIYVDAYEFGEIENQIDLYDNQEYTDFLLSADDETLKSICDNVENYLSLDSFKRNIERFKENPKYSLTFETYIYMGGAGIVLTIDIDDFIYKAKREIEYRLDREIDLSEFER